MVSQKTKENIQRQMLSNPSFHHFLTPLEYHALATGDFKIRRTKKGYDIEFHNIPQF